MSLSHPIKPISYLKSAAPRSSVSAATEEGPLIVTQNGEAEAVIRDIDRHEQMQETLALLELLALGRREVEAGNVRPASDVIARLRERDLA